MQLAREYRRGMTLVELLVVVTILTLLVAVAIPVMRPSLKDRKLREASRQVNTFIALAKAKAVETGRPHGIWIARDPNNTNAAYQIFLAESPPAFAGDSIGATATMQQSSTYPGYADSAQISDIYNVVKAGDFIRFGFKGPLYQISNVVVGPPSTVTFAATPGTSLPPYVANMPFQVFRQPTRMTTQPLQLPTGTVIDLAYSGIGYNGVEMNTFNGDIVVTFQPGGGVHQMLAMPYVYGQNYFPIPGTIHLLIGRVEQTPFLEADSTKHNLVDGSASWVSIGHLTGTVTTSENYYDPSQPQTIAAARKIAQSKQTMGGR